LSGEKPELHNSQQEVCVFAQTHETKKKKFFSKNTNAYSFGFNGKLHDDDIYGKDNSYDYGAIFYDSRVADFLGIYPFESKYPYYSSFQFASRNPIEASDLDGKEPDYINPRFYASVKSGLISCHRFAFNSSKPTVYSWILLLDK
jgi:hypothetical protein